LTDIISGVLDARAYTTPIAKTIDTADMAIISFFWRFEYNDESPPSAINSESLVFSAHFCLVTRRGSFCMKSGSRSNFTFGLLAVVDDDDDPSRCFGPSSFVFGGGIGPTVGRALFVPTMPSPCATDAPRSCCRPFAMIVDFLAERRPHDGANARTLPPLLLLTEHSPMTATSDNDLFRIRSLISET
jgi:hypothetical protein